MNRLRKTLYTLYIGAILMGLLTEEIAMSNWKLLLTLSAFVLFIDLAILLTPSITKIWNAEFQYSEEVEENLEKNDRLLNSTLYRVQTMSNIIQNAGAYIDDLPFDEEGRMRSLKSFVDVYGIKYGLKTDLWEINSVYEVNEVSSEELKELISEQFTLISEMYGFEQDDKREENIELLANSSLIFVSNDDFILIPVFMKGNNMIVAIENKKGELLEVDGVHITNLIFLHQSFYLNLWYNE